MIKKSVIIILTVVLAACRSEPAPTPPPTPESIVEEVAETEPTATDEPTATSPASSSTDTPVPVEATATPLAEVEEPASTEAAEATPEGEPVEVAIEPIEVTYFTPAQQEGPYYTVEKPADRDNDLTVLAGAAAAPAGQVLEFSGTVYNANGLPMPGVTVEIWQTDNNGVYLHPNDPTTEQRDQNFQFYGESVTGGDGRYNFRTVLPGQYEPRPRHIHLKVKNGEEELLTSQIYFQGDPALATDGIFGGESENEHLVMTVEGGQDGNGTSILLGEHNLILDTMLDTLNMGQ